MHDDDVAVLNDPQTLLYLKQTISADPTLVLLRILDYLYFNFTVAQISHCTKTNIKHVKECICHLAHFDYIFLMKPFQFSDKYRITN